MGEYLAPETSVNSVTSVGGSSPPETSARIYFSGCVGMAGMPYPPNPQSVGVFVGKYLSKKYLCASVTSVGAFVGGGCAFCVS